MSQRRDLLLSDYAGHAFSYELAVAVNRSAGPTTAYSFCSSLVSPKGKMSEDDCLLLPVSSGKSFERYNLFRRAVAELRYGAGTARAVWRTRPQAHVVCNMPLVALLVIWLLTIPLRSRLVVWFQDVQSGLATGLLGESRVTRAISVLESFLLRRASRVIAISSELAEEALRRGVAAESLGIMENWAPIESIDVRPKDNPWSRAHDAHDRLTFLYSGTLARKHNPALLVDLARTLRAVGGQVIVVSEGEGSDWLRAERSTAGDLDNLRILPYQPFDQLPDVVGAADVLIVLLEPLAAPFSVPSKTLTYLCAGRAILGSILADNTAGRMIREGAGAGVVVDPADVDGFEAAALTLATDAELRHRLGQSGRSFAEEHFTSSVVLRNFLDQLASVER